MVRGYMWVRQTSWQDRMEGEYCEGGKRGGDREIVGEGG